MSFEALKREVDNGMNGRNNGIPMGFHRLNRYIGIRKRMYFVAGFLFSYLWFDCSTSSLFCNRIIAASLMGTCS